MYTVELRDRSGAQRMQSLTPYPESAFIAVVLMMAILGQDLSEWDKLEDEETGLPILRHRQFPQKEAAVVLVEQSGSLLN